MSDRSPLPVFRVRATAMLLAAAALLQACGADLPESGEPAAATAVVSETVATQTWRDSIEALGTAKANESVTLTAKVSETVRKVAFDSGDVVRAGDVIVDLSSGAQLAGLEEARAAFQESERQLARGQELAPDEDHFREPARHAAIDARRREGPHGRGARAALGPRDHGALRRDPRPAPGQPRLARDAGHADRDARRHIADQARLPGSGAIPGRAGEGPGSRPPGAAPIRSASSAAV